MLEYVMMMMLGLNIQTLYSDSFNFRCRPSFRRFASFRSSLNEILYEEDEDNEEEEEIEEIVEDNNKKSQDTRIPFSFR